MEIGALADEIRAHRDQHVHLFEAATVDVEQDLHELGRFVAGAGLLDFGLTDAEPDQPEPEQFLELVDDQEQGPVAETARLV